MSISVLPAQVFFSDTTANFFGGTPPVGLYDGSLNWGDFDQDGDLDILATGRAGTVDFRTRVFRFNTTLGTFSEFSGAADLVDLYLSDAQFGDYDNDGDLDIAICGKDNGANRHTKIYYFDQNQNRFREDSTASPCLAGVENGHLAWGDYNNDGLLDLAVMGRNAAGLQTQIYQNEGFGVFVPTFSLSPGVELGEITWGDVNGDGFLDIFYTGANSSGSPITRLFLNDQGNGFTFKNSGLTNLRNSSIDLADYDTDGDLDVLLTGATNSGGTSLFTQVFTNIGGAAFFSLNAGLTPIKNGTAKWGDVNNDGRPDILLSGADGNGSNDRLTELYFNQSGSSFVLQGPSSAAFDQANGNAEIAWADVDGDDKLDVLLSGTIGTSSHTLKLYYNYEPTADVTQPPLPNGLATSRIGDTIFFSWSTPNAGYPTALKPGLTYNLFVGSASGLDDIVPAMADKGTGFRRIVQMGTIKPNSWKIVGLDPGNYRWKVQSIDPGFESSAFSAEGSFTMPGSLPAAHFIEETGAEFGGLAPAGMADSDVSWIDYDQDGDLDLLMCGLVSDLEPGSFDVRTQLYENTASGFVQVPGAGGLPNLYQASIEWGDINLDNLPDVVLSGRTLSSELTRIYVNQGNGTFTQLTASLSQVSNGSLDFGDYDQDGDLDLLLTGSGTGTQTKVYENRWIPTQSLTFQENVPASNNLTNVFGGDAAWGDYNNDGYPDILLTGKNGSGNLVGELYRNNKVGGFSVYSNANIPSVWQSSVSFGDVDNDGLQDLIIAGDLSANTSNNNPGVFFKHQQRSLGDTLFPVAGSLPGRAGGSVDLGDYNDDGFLDLLLTGEGTVDTVHYSEVYVNNGNSASPAFLLEPLASTPLRGVNNGSSAAWGDYNGDKKLDIFLTGLLPNGGKVAKLYRNIETTPNTIPQPPTGLAVAPVGFGVNLSWDLPPALAAVEDGLSFAVYARKLGAPADSLLRSPEADLVSGFRRVAEMGRQGNRREVLLTNLTPGLYEWTVQTIDQDLEGSVFQQRDTFTYENPSFTEATTSFFPPGVPPSGITDARIAFGDFRNNGFLDLIAIGRSNANAFETQLFRYDQVTQKYSLSPFSASFLDVREGSVDWGDHNRDGFADVLLTGLSVAGRVARVYTNNSAAFQSGGFITLSGGGVSNGCGVFGDYNNDGFEDIFLTGTNTGGQPSATLYRNTGTGSFQDMGTAGLPALTNSWADWGDVNNDGYLDLLIAGLDGSTAITEIYLNQKDGSFSLLSGQPFAGVQSGTVALGDVDSDGFLDVGLVGENGNSTQQFAEAWRNNGDGTFSPMGSLLGGLSKGSLDWGDFNDDGYKDLILTGQNGPTASDRTVQLYRYDAGLGILVYETIGSSEFTPVAGGSDAAWGDIDRDGKLDLIIVGEQDGTASGASFLLYQNINNIYPNITPSPPSKLAASIQGYEVLLGWDGPANVEDSVLAGISYNVYVGTTLGAIDRRSPLASLGNGVRKVVAKGVVSDTTNFRLSTLPPGKYYWSVQAIDADFEASGFASIDSFEYLPPTFVDQTNDAFSGFPDGVSDGSMEWGDYNSDGFLDLLAVGRASMGAVSLLYKNNGDGTFSEVTPGITPLLFTDVAWGDYNNDGRLDFLLSGETFGGLAVTELYRNDGGDAFTIVSSGIDSVSKGANAWADFDFDGRLDVAIMGNDGSEPILNIYRQTEAGDFVSLNLGLEGIQDGDLKWIDVNKDGFWDLLATGRNDQNTPAIFLYLNDGNGSFQELSNTLIPAADGSLDIGDFDNDGWSDFLLAGQDNNGVRAVRVYRNLAGSTDFSLYASFLDTAGVIQGEARWGDYDDNGRLDIVLAGTSSTGRTVRVIRNQFVAGSSLFQIRTIAGLPLKPATGASLAWGDYDNDGKLDLAIGGETSISPAVRGIRLYQNIDSTLNLTPPVPTSLDFAYDADTVILSWNMPVGNQGLTSTLYVRSPSGVVDIFSPHADTDNGFRRIAQPGNAGQKRSWKLRNLENGSYFWSVQSIDHDYEGSDFATEQPFTFTAPDLVENNLNYLDLQGNIPTGYAQGDLAWADYDGDADLDLLVSGETGIGTAATVLLKNNNSVFEADLAASAVFADLRYSTAAWGDYNNDGHPDLLLAGETEAIGGAGIGTLTTELYRNNGNGTFISDPKGAKFPELTLAAAAWADFDQDGDLDLILTGRSPFGPVSELFLNQDSVFLPYPFIDLVQVEAGAVAWGDFDQDGDLDLAVSGNISTGGRSSRIYRNNGLRGGFTRLDDTQAPLTPVGEAGLAWGDLNNDGFLELVLNGESQTSPSVPVTEMYRFNAVQDRFELVPGITLPGLKAGEVAWGDYDDDGFQDLVITGTNPGGGRLTRLYQNNQAGGLLEAGFASEALLNADMGSRVAWADIDNDGKLDLALAGQVADTPSELGLRLYQNRNDAPNVSPLAPTGLSIASNADSVVLSWVAPASAVGVSYNLIIGTSPNFEQIKSPLSHVPLSANDGYRKVVQRGNAGSRLDWRAVNLPADTYYWTVQSIDQDFEGSAFAQIDSFTFVPPHFTDITSIGFDPAELLALDNGALAWGDVDGDNDLDLMVSGQNTNGQAVATFYENINAKDLVANPTIGGGVTATINGDLDWHDYDADGDLDLLITGLSNNGPSSLVYEFDAGVLQAQDLGFTPLRSGLARWVDADNDGDVDVFLTGLDNTSVAVSELHLNSGAGSFRLSTSSFQSLAAGDLAWSDFDRNSLTDLFLIGVDGSNSPRVLMYQNEGMGRFTERTTILNPLPAFVQASVDAGDMNNDGYPDLLITGEDATGQAYSFIYVNRADSSLNFDRLDLGTSPLEGVKLGDASWGDYNEDGWLDIVMTGESNSGDLVVRVYESLNQGTAFRLDSLAIEYMNPVYNASISWADMNNDRKLDVAMIGRSSVSPQQKNLFLYRNDEPNRNVIPVAPENLREEVIGDVLILSWDLPAGVDSSRAMGYSYNLYLGSAENTDDIMPATADLNPGFSNGYYRIVQAAEGLYRTQWFVEGLDEGQSYFWGVQSIDQDFEGSAFVSKTLDFTPPAFSDVTDEIFPNGVPLGLTGGAIAVADVDLDGDLDVVAAGETGINAPSTALYRKEGNIYVLDTLATSVLNDVSLVALDWGDYNLDGYPDLALSGRLENGDFITHLYQGSPEGMIYDESASESLPGLVRGSMDWGDYDNDGDQDLVMAGSPSVGPAITRVYRNLGEEGFEMDSLASNSLSGIENGELAWADYDTDGDLDLVVSGTSATGGITHVYRNDRQSRFVLKKSLAQLENSRVAWGDVYNLGNPGLLIAGYNEDTEAPFTQYYRYDAADTVAAFVPDTTIRLVGVSEGDVAFMDYDDDGFLDILITGLGENGRVTKVYNRNDEGKITEDLNTSGGLTNVDLGTVAWGDYDNDQKTDLFLSGRTSASPSLASFALFRNIDSTTNTTYEPPTRLKHQIFGPTITFRWQPPLGLSSLEESSLSFNFYLGTTGNRAERVSALAETTEGASNGYRRLVEVGNVGHSRSWKISGIPDGDYVWSVQIVDPDREGSAFASEIPFTFTNPIPVIVDSSFADQWRKGEAAANTWISVSPDSVILDVIVHHRGIADKEWQETSLSKGSDNRFTFALDTDQMDEIGAEYYFEVIGDFGFSARTDTHYTYTYYPDGLTVSDIRFGKEVRDYNIVSVPLNLDNSSIEEVILDDFGKYNVYQWRLWQYDQGVNTEVGSGLTEMLPGIGYWLITKEQRTFNTGPGEALRVHAADPYVLSLKVGWNQIGNPYPYKIIWNDVLDSNVVAQAQLGPMTLYGSTGYLPGQDGIDAFSGAFVYTDSALDLRIPVTKNDAILRRPKLNLIHLGPLDSDTWQVPLVLEAGDLMYPVGGFGMRKDAELSKDRYDVVSLPRLDRYLDVHTNHPEFRSTRFSRDIVPTADSYVWEFTVSSNLGEPSIEMSWKNEAFEPGEKRLILFDLEHQIAVDMQEQSRYLSLSQREERHFRLYYGDDAFLAERLQPDFIHLGLAYPNPSAGKVFVPFSLPPSQETYQVEMQVFSLDGRKLASPINGEYPAGFHTLNWDRADARGNPLSAGVYLYQLRVRQGEEYYQEVRRLIVR